MGVYMEIVVLSKIAIRIILREKNTTFNLYLMAGRKIPDNIFWNDAEERQKTQFTWLEYDT